MSWMISFPKNSHLECGGGIRSLWWWLWAVNVMVVLVLRWVDDIETGNIHIEEGLRRMKRSSGRRRRACSWVWESWWCCIWEQCRCCSCCGRSTTGLILRLPCPNREALGRPWHKTLPRCSFLETKLCFLGHRTHKQKHNITLTSKT